MDITSTQRRALTVAETMAATTLSRSTLMRLIADGELKAKRVGTRVLIPPDEVDRFLTSSD